MLGHLAESKDGQSKDMSSYETFAMEGFEAYYVHIVVHHDTSYSFQSWAHVDVWNPATLTWNRVANLLHSEIIDKYETAELLRTLALIILWGEDPR